ncbi:MAG: Rpn family recombination-promoting nuclease/putative transposase [Methylococcaceae bacterium]
MSKTHDSSYKFLFSNPELVRDLVMGFIPDDWLHGLDYSALEKVPGSYVSDDFQQCEDDIIWKAALTHNPMRPENQSIQHIALLQEKFHCTSI